MTNVKLGKAGKEILEALDQALEDDVVAFEVNEDGIDVKEIREALGMDREAFALAFNLSKYSVRNWELGVRKPRGPALALLQIIAKDPVHVYHLLHPGY